MGAEDAEEGFSLGQVIAKRDTEKALLVMTADLEDLWIPKSVIHDDSNVSAVGDEGELIVKEWWAEANDLT